MDIVIQLTDLPILEKISPPAGLDGCGAWLEFRGLVRGEESSKSIAALEYEAYPEMAQREIRRLLETISKQHPCLAAKVIHRVGVIPAGEAAVYLGVAAKHRAEAIALLAEFMNRLKQDVPIWKRRAVPANVPLVAGIQSRKVSNVQSAEAGSVSAPALFSIDEAIASIHAHCQPMAGERVSLANVFGRVLRETVCAPEDLPAHDRSTRDGYAILSEDISEVYQIVETIHAADWKPHPLRPGEAARVATGAVLPCDGVRVVKQEDVVRSNDEIRITRREAELNLRKRGEDVKAGDPLVPGSVRLDAGRLALLATAGCTKPLVSPTLRVCHFTTGDELVPPEQTPGPGQIRDSNSVLIRSMLESYRVELIQAHLPENFDTAWRRLDLRQIATADMVLVSGGASVGEKDFTRQLLERLGFNVVFAQVDVRPGKPLIFCVDASRVAFGLPGNPLSHFVCFHFAVATALARLTGDRPPAFLRGRLAATMDDEPCPRETLSPARVEFSGGKINLHPIPWASSADVTCFAAASALIRIPANAGLLAAGSDLEFLPTANIVG